MNRSKITWRVVPAVILVLLLGLGIYLSEIVSAELAWLPPILLTASLLVILLPIKSGFLRVKSIIIACTLITAGFYHANQQKEHRRTLLPHESILKSSHQYTFLLKGSRCLISYPIRRARTSSQKTNRTSQTKENL